MIGILVWDSLCYVYNRHSSMGQSMLYDRHSSMGQSMLYDRHSSMGQSMLCI